MRSSDSEAQLCKFTPISWLQEIEVCPDVQVQQDEIAHFSITPWVNAH